jgi:hypothetical protein
VNQNKLLVAMNQNKDTSTETSTIIKMNDNIILTEVAYTDNGLSIVLKNLLGTKKADALILLTQRQN